MAIPYGGPDRARWTPEAWIANELRSVVREVGVRDGVTEAVLSIPVMLQDSDYRPYGDGQSNARPGFGPYWHEAGPPLVAARIRFRDGREELRVRFHEALHVTKYSVSEVNWRGRAWKFVRPEGWRDGFVVGFDSTGVIPFAELARGLPDGARRFADGRTTDDPAHVKERARAEGVTPFRHLLAAGAGDGYNARPYEVDSIHGWFPAAGAERTATGGGWTWVIDRGALAPFKHLYTCFQGRDPGAEAVHGVASGAGWHRIGDPAETILNSLEEEALPVAIGARVTGIPVGEGGLAYGLDSVVTARALGPGEAFVTAQGEYHWYAIPAARELCTEIWVHPCVPNPGNGWGFRCD